MNLLDNDITTDQRPYIIELQGYLRTIQRAHQGSTTVPQDGYYGPTTMEAVRQFQQEEGLTPTGQVDYATPTSPRRRNHLRLSKARVIPLSQREIAAIRFYFSTR